MLHALDKLTMCKNLKQVWFPGVHSNVGGSYDDTSTANITLAWMMDQLSGDEQKQMANTLSGWDVANWIEFDDGYLRRAFDQNHAWWRKQHREPHSSSHHFSYFHAWANGTIYNSLSFPQSLAGSKIRTPGRYRPTSYQSGQEDEQRLLENTYEYIHASVRARIDLGGCGTQESCVPIKISGIWDWIKSAVGMLFGPAKKIRSWYQPHRLGPLAGWSLQDGHDSHNVPNNGIALDGRRPGWEYDGRDSLMLQQKPERRAMTEDRLGTYETKLLRMYSPDFAKEMVASNAGLKGVDELPNLVDDDVLRLLTSVRSI